MVAVVLQSIAIAQNPGNIADTDNKVAAIKSNLVNYRTEETTYPAHIVNTTYYDNKTIKAVRTFYIDNNVNKTVTAYFSDGQMIYHEQIWTDNEGKIIHTELSYLEDHHLVKWSLDNKEMARSEQYWKSWDKQLCESSKSHRKNT